MRFDLSAIGIPAGQKPGQEWVYQADKTLLRLALAHPGLQEGKLGTGDFFLTDVDRKRDYIERFGITAFDMEPQRSPLFATNAEFPLYACVKYRMMLTTLHGTIPGNE